MSGSLPPPLKGIAQYLVHAQQLAKVDPIMSYFCRLYAVQQGVAVYQQNPRDEAVKRAVVGLMTQMETDKKQLAPMLEAQPAGGREYVERFAERVFRVADDEDRAGAATKATAKSFLAAAAFIEVLRQFGELSPQHAGQLKYAKWKAADISAAIREGRVPVAGSPADAEGLSAADSQLLSELDDPQQQQQQAGPGDGSQGLQGAQGASQGFPQFPGVPQQQQQQGAPAGFPGGFPMGMPQFPAPPSDLPARQTQQGGPAGFTGATQQPPGGLPQFPVSPADTPARKQQQGPPGGFPQFPSAPSDLPSQKQPYQGSPAGFPQFPSAPGDIPAKDRQQGPSAGQAAHHDAPSGSPYTQAPYGGSQVPYGGPQQKPSSQPVPKPQPSASAAPAPVKADKLSLDSIEKAAKYCKFASSALNFEDAPTAVQNLLLALQTLTGKTYGPTS